jgi:hypothetical protein
MEARRRRRRDYPAGNGRYFGLRKRSRNWSVLPEVAKAKVEAALARLGDLA